MKFKTWPVAALGLIGLLALTAVSILASSRRAQEIYTKLDELNTFHRTLDANLQQLRTDIRKTEIVARDYLLDLERGSFGADPSLVNEYRDRLTLLRRSNTETLAELQKVATRDADKIQGLQAKLADYWQTFDPLFAWTPAVVRQGETRFLRRAMVPRREAILAIAKDIQELNDTNLAAQRASVARREAAFRADTRRLLYESVGLGLIVALIAVFRLRMLERRSEQGRAISDETARQMRQLSQQLVAAQEAERKNLSRELHDHVAQVLTALRMELSRIERIRPHADLRIGAAVVECKGLVDKMFRTVRDLTLGLRPTMLDDFGLQPALEWQVRDLMKRANVSIELQTEGDLETLPDTCRTCVFRAVQEAMTNCVRHSGAGTIRVAVTRRRGALDVSVSDDGIGFNLPKRRPGLGLKGIEERVKELNGTLAIDSGPRQGTRLSIHLPLPTDGMIEMPLARVAG